mmetsp:Transcript_25691/g.59883  ORF Transcript_25691/g.59883 Transcript_25691/m.59883 type:complete len:614 (-) Transcript_25691:79-1920(-)
MDDSDLWEALEESPASKVAKKSDAAAPPPPPPDDAPPPPPGPPDDAAPPPPDAAPPPPSAPPPPRAACAGCDEKLTGKPLVCSLCVKCRFTTGDPFRPGRLLGWSMLKVQGSNTIDIPLASILSSGTGTLPPGQTLEARCLRVDAPEWRYELSHCWPGGVSLFVGEERVKKKTPDEEHDEAPGPLDLTRYCYHRPQGPLLPLKIRAAIMAKREEQWALGIVLVTPTTDASICQKIIKQQAPSEERLLMDSTRVRAWVAEHRPDRVSRKDTLRCVEPPVLKLQDCMSLIRISTAARGDECDHLQCFDLESFVHTMRNIPPKHGWCCPVCDKPTPLHRIRLDAFAQQVLDKAPENAMEVLVADTGKWEVSAFEEEVDDDNSDDDDAPAHLFRQAPTQAQLQQQLMNLGRGFTAPVAAPPAAQPPAGKKINIQALPERKPSGEASRSERREKDGDRKRSRSPRGRQANKATPNAAAAEEKDGKMLAWEKLQGIAKQKEETRIGWLPDGTKCSMCEKSVVERGGVWCGRKRPSCETAGCFKAVCWKCMNKRGKDGVGGIRTTKAEFAEIGPAAWWMHEACMSGEDRKAYFGEEDDADDVDKPKDEEEDDGPATFAWE